YAIAVALAPAAHDQRTAVFEERSPDAAGQLNGSRTVPADLEETAALVLLGAGDGAGPQECADIHGAAGRGVVHQLLHRRPVHVFEIGAADSPPLIHGASTQGDVKLHVVIVRLRLAQVFQRLRGLRRALKADRSPRHARRDT